MKPATLVLLPDRLTDPFTVLRIEAPDRRQTVRGSLRTIRTGEEGADLPGLRRYETTDPSNQHRVDLVNHRVVIHPDNHATALRERRLPEWSRRTSALHPDRHDVASWFDAARKAPSSPWVAHLPLALRDALRSHDRSPDCVLLLSDRTLYAASEDDEHAVLAPLRPALEGPAHEIDPQCHRTGRALAPIKLADTGTDHRRHGLVTRAQGIIAEALVNAHDAHPLPTADDLPERWGAIVNRSHATRLRRVTPTRFSAPLAILDDHRNGADLATLLLATIHIVLDPAAPDITITYHAAWHIRASRPMIADLAGKLIPEQGDPDHDRADLIRAIHDQDLPVLEIAAAPNGTFASRALIDALDDASPLMPTDPGFTLTDAALAILHFREPAAHDRSSGFSWITLLPHMAARPSPPTDRHEGGELDPNGAGTDEKVADQTEPPSPDQLAPETDHAGEPDPAREADDGSRDEGAEGEATTGDAEDGDIDQATISTTGDSDSAREDTDDERDRSVGGAGDQAGQARLALSRPRDADPSARVAEAVGGTLAGAEPVAHPSSEVARPSPPTDRHEGGEPDPNGAGTDEKVADQTEPPSPDQLAPETDHAGEPDPAREADDGSRDEGAEGEANGDALLDAITSALTDTDRAVLDKARTVAARQKKTRIPSTDELFARQKDVSARLGRLYGMLILDPVSQPTLALKNARLVLEGDEAWAKTLVALAILQHHMKSKERPHAYTKKVYTELMRMAQGWAKAADLDWPSSSSAPATDAERRPKPAGPNTLRRPPSSSSGAGHG